MTFIHYLSKNCPANCTCVYTFLNQTVSACKRHIPSYNLSRAIFFAFLLLANSLNADQAKDESPNETASFSELSRTSHSTFVNGKEIAYEAICGNLKISSDSEKVKGALFFTAYCKKPTKTQNKKRPICFCFNGGPGSSSVWLHMGFGPKKPVLNTTTYTKPPSTYEHNPYTLLDQTDLVFIDPISTGFSKTPEGVNPKQFHGIEEDIDSFADFIRIFITKFDRWDSPKFLLGESYGTIRAVGLAEKLHSTHFIDLNGVILISMCLDFQAYDFGNGNDLPNSLTLPTYTATAWYHNRLKPELQSIPLPELLKEVEHFALNDYATALLLGNTQDEKQRLSVLKRLSEYTSLDPSYLNASSLRIVTGAFFKELFRKDHKIVGRFDSRYVGVEQHPLEEMSHTDPSFDAIVGPFTASFHHYLSRELKITDLAPYKVLNSDTIFPWNFSINRLPAGLGYVYTSGKLSSAIEKNPSLKVFVASGRYDLATPYFAADYTISHLKLTPELMKNVSNHYYDSGHMIYLDPISHAKMKRDLDSFIEEN